MGVHGMRNVTAANQIKDLLDQRHTPESLAAAIQGILKFSRSFTERMGGGVEPGNANATGEFKPPVGGFPTIPNIRIPITQQPSKPVVVTR